MKTMMRTLAAFGLVAAMALPASAYDLGGKMGLGMASAIGGASGLAFDYGLGNLHAEVLLSHQMVSPKEGAGTSLFALGLGAHYQVLFAGDAAVTAGLRLNFGMAGSPDATTPDDADDTTSVSQIGIDVPIRVYWWASENFSLHGETGIRYSMAGEDGGAFFGNSAPPEGSSIGLFSDLIGGAGMTFWW